MKLEEGKALTDALAFYANTDNWRSPSTGFAAQYDPEPSPVSKDGGQRAQLAMAAFQAADDSYANALNCLANRAAPAWRRRLICSKCGACAGHPEDRDGDKCRHCGERATVAQERGSSGVWVFTAPAPAAGETLRKVVLE